MTLPLSIFVTVVLAALIVRVGVEVERVELTTAVPAFVPVRAN